MSCTETQWEHLDKNFGHEIAVLLLNEPMTCPELYEKILYKVSKDQIRTNLNKGFKKGVFSLVGELGDNRYQFEESEFNETQIREINRRALTRITSPAKEWGPVNTLDEVPDEFFYKYGRHEVKKEETFPHYVIFFEEDRGRGVGYTNKMDHANKAKNESTFLGGITEPWDIE